VKISDDKICEIAKLDLSLPESARRAGMSRANFRNRAQKLGYEIKPGRSGRVRLFHGCGIRGCTEPHYSNRLCRRHFNQWYYQQNPDKFKDRAKKQREARRQQVSREELERLRSPENRAESLSFGPDKKIVHLACGWIGEDLTHHIRHCPVKSENWKTYSEYWGFDPSVPPVSPKQREAYSETQTMNWKSFERRSKMARNRWGKGSGARLHMRKFANRKILETVAANPDLSIIEGARLVHMSPVGFYNRVKKLGDFRNLVPAPRPQREFVRLASNPQLRSWIASQPRDFSDEQLMQFCMDNLDHGWLTPSQFALFILHLEKELREHSELIAQIGAEVREHKPSQSAMRLGNYVFARARASRSTQSLPVPGTGGRPKKQMPRYRVFGETVNALIPRFESAFRIYAQAKKDFPNNPIFWRSRLESAKFALAEIEAVLASRSAESAAQRFAMSFHQPRICFPSTGTQGNCRKSRETAFGTFKVPNIPKISRNRCFVN
jgi:hypothetical protein